MAAAYPTWNTANDEQICVEEDSIKEPLLSRDPFPIHLDWESSGNVKEPLAHHQLQSSTPSMSAVTQTQSTNNINQPEQPTTHIEVEGPLRVWSPRDDESHPDTLTSSQLHRVVNRLIGGKHSISPPDPLVTTSLRCTPSAASTSTCLLLPSSVANTIGGASPKHRCFHPNPNDIVFPKPSVYSPPTQPSSHHQSTKEQQRSTSMMHHHHHHHHASSAMGAAFALGATQDFLSLSLSPPICRRREMPALRGPFVSL